MRNRGRVTDNIVIERLWRRVKHEDVYLRDYADEIEACRDAGTFFGD